MCISRVERGQGEEEGTGQPSAAGGTACSRRGHVEH